MSSRDISASAALRLLRPAVVTITAVVALLSGLLATGPASAHAAATPTDSGAVGATGGADAPARAVLRTAFENKVVAKTNKRRAKHGCRPLKANARLQSAARSHTYAMADAGKMAHVLPGGPSLTARIERAGYRSWRLLAENVAAGFTRPGTVVRAWMRSPGHRRNILDCRLREIGVGVVSTSSRTWWTQDFGRR